MAFREGMIVGPQVQVLLSGRVCHGWNSRGVGSES
jgi:hypothetical protein